MEAKLEAGVLRRWRGTSGWESIQESGLFRSGYGVFLYSGGYIIRSKQIDRRIVGMVARLRQRERQCGYSVEHTPSGERASGYSKKAHGYGDRTGRMTGTADQETHLEERIRGD